MTGRFVMIQLYRHATARGLAQGLLEVRQDLICDTPGVAEWTERLAPMLELAYLRDDMHIIRHYGSRTDGTAKQRRIYMSGIDQTNQTELEAAAFRSSVKHLRERTDVQNIEMMNLTGFCRNCLSRWYMEAAHQKGLDLNKEGAREIVYGMPYDQWRDQYQTEASDAQMAAFKSSHGQ